MGSQIVVLAYIAPEVALPVASALAGVIGFVMMVGWIPVRFAAKGFRGVGRRIRSIAQGFDRRGTRPPRAT